MSDQTTAILELIQEQFDGLRKELRNEINTKFDEYKRGNGKGSDVSSPPWENRWVQVVKKNGGYSVRTVDSPECREFVGKNWSQLTRGSVDLKQTTAESICDMVNQMIYHHLFSA